VFDCAAIAPSLIESALFGHERGAFTGATEKRVGLIEEAAGGTLFIDEIGELPLSLQPRLLRFLERREVQRVGSNQVRTFDVRVIAATHRNLLAAINERTFREDLYFRLAVMRLRIPPLRERVGDLPRLVESLLTQRLGSAERAKEKLNTVSRATWDTLKSLPWRGNVRELRNVLDHSLALSPDGALTFEFDSEALPTPNPTSGPAPAVDLSQPFITQRDAMLEGFERVYLGGILEKAEGNFSRAAALAGLDRMHLKRLRRRHGLGS
jgi:transcriptional regulator with PAS, ATPase and Fis domain